jgi:hypothetical protein
MPNRLKSLLVLLVGLFLVAGCNNPLVAGDSIRDFNSEDGSRIELHNNPSAVDISYAELVNFIDIVRCKKGPCLQLAGALHDKAEVNGIRAGVRIVQLIGEHHAMTVFQTTDRGEVFVDLTISREVDTWETYRKHLIFVGHIYEFW